LRNSSDLTSSAIAEFPRDSHSRLDVAWRLNGPQENMEAPRRARPGPFVNRGPPLTTWRHGEARVASRLIASPAAPGRGDRPARSVGCIVSFPVQLWHVGAVPNANEIRVYRPADVAKAQDLQKALALNARIVNLGNAFPNLPAGRMEIWLKDG
jgi:hypothetical protein